MQSKYYSGSVIPGNGQGRALGFPTANIQLEENNDIPVEGIYAGYAHIFTQKYKAAIHAGPRPAINDSRYVIEAHLLNFPDQDLYGEKIEIKLIRKLRDIKNFDTMEKLTAAIQKDCKNAAELLS